VALYEGSGGGRLLLWSLPGIPPTRPESSPALASRNGQAAHQAVITGLVETGTEWQSPDGRTGFILREESGYSCSKRISAGVEKRRGNHWRNYVLSRLPRRRRARRQQPVAPLLIRCGRGRKMATTPSPFNGRAASRHDRNSVGAADRYLLGALGESRRTASMKNWELGGGLVARHESEGRRGTTKMTWLPWGVLASRCSARLPQSPGKTISRASFLWGLGASFTRDGTGGQSLHLLPYGLLLRRATAPGQTSTHVLGTGFSRKDRATARFNGAFPTVRNSDPPRRPGGGPLGGGFAAQSRLARAGGAGWGFCPIWRAGRRPPSPAAGGVTHRRRCPPGAH